MCISRCCVCCLSIATRKSGDDIHDFCCCHLWCWWSWFSEYCIRPRIVFYILTSEYNSTLVFLVLCLQFSIFQMTCPSVMQNELLHPSSLLHRSPLSWKRAILIKDSTCCAWSNRRYPMCWEVGFVRRPHHLVGGVRSVPTNLVEVEGQQELREIEGE